MKKVTLAIYLILALTANTSYAKLNIVTSIKPLYSLVAMVVGDNAQVHLLMDGSQSPHNYSMQPSGMKKISDADLIFYISDNLESFLPKILNNVKDEARIYELIDAQGLTLLKTRDEDGKREYENQNEESHAHNGYDPHVWLSPSNAVVIINFIKNKMVEADSQNADNYNFNAQDAIERINNLGEQIKDNLLPYKNVNFIVFHDAFGYFENYANISFAGAIIPPSGGSIGAKRLKNIERVIAEKNIKCIFYEPQFPESAIKAISQNNKINVSLLDPLGSNVKADKDSYITILNNIELSVRSCLSHD